MHNRHWAAAGPRRLTLSSSMGRLLHVPLPDEHSLLPEHSSWEELRHTRSEMTIFPLAGLETLPEHWVIGVAGGDNRSLP
jgi:hypothetical protein